MSDLVSIIMPSYNTAQYITETIQSVIDQTYHNWELIIVDDCSTDNTDIVIGKIKDPRIRYIKNEKNSGAAVSRNRALREANGRWVAFLDSDDLWKPEKLEKQICFMMKNRYYFSYAKQIFVPCWKYLLSGSIMLLFVETLKTKFSGGIVSLCVLICTGGLSYVGVLLILRDRFFIDNINKILKRK